MKFFFNFQYLISFTFRKPVKIHNPTNIFKKKPMNITLNFDLLIRPFFLTLGEVGFSNSSAWIDD